MSLIWHPPGVTFRLRAYHESPPSKSPLRRPPRAGPRRPAPDRGDSRPGRWSARRQDPWPGHGATGAGLRHRDDRAVRPAQADDAGTTVRIQSPHAQCPSTGSNRGARRAHDREGPAGHRVSQRARRSRMMQTHRRRVRVILTLVRK